MSSKVNGITAVSVGSSILPAVDRTKISAKYDNGVLNLELPKQAEQATAANRIEIQ
ncbi:Hsp20 family protein [Latilactobacillus fuchuensis]|uniref:Hsp20 family protein n=1 Tax=Latilactobacillus fuchuensis TaxID=164393 RepID=UPI0030845160